MQRVREIARAGDRHEHAEHPGKELDAGFLLRQVHGRVTVDGLDDVATGGKLEQLRGNVFSVPRDDSGPTHRDGRLIVKWDLDNQKPMKGAATRRILELIAELEGGAGAHGRRPGRGGFR